VYNTAEGAIPIYIVYKVVKKWRLHRLDVISHRHDYKC